MRLIMPCIFLLSFINKEENPPHGTNITKWG